MIPRAFKLSDLGHRLYTLLLLRERAQDLAETGSIAEFYTASCERWTLENAFDAAGGFRGLSQLEISAARRLVRASRVLRVVAR